jgi:ribonuclease R
MDAEREVMDVKKARFMRQHLGEEMPGMILSIDQAGLWIELTDYLIDGLVPMGSLTDDVYERDRSSRSIVGMVRGRRLRLGDIVRVKVERVDVEQRQIDFSLVGPVDGGRRDRPGRPERRQQQRLAKRQTSSRRPAGRRSSGARRPSSRRGPQGRKR